MKSCAVALLAVVLVGCHPSGAPLKGLGNRVTFHVPGDSVTLAGATWGSAPVGVVFAHTFRDTKESWAPFAETIASRGFLTLAFDFRGYGESKGKKDPSKNDVDLEAAIAEIKALGATKVFLVGASMGGTAALVVAAREELAGVVAVSVPTEFSDIDALAAAPSIEEPLLLVAADGDPDGAATSARRLEAATGNSTLDVIRGSRAHGTDLLEGPTAGRVSTDIAQFLIDHR
ncbi:MAG: alpha/beta hydrolase [Actinomycetota bacterium]|nr:alpha/beta hydrolase [Actinomycetota bacterium]